MSGSVIQSLWCINEMFDYSLWIINNISRIMRNKTKDFWQSMTKEKLQSLLQICFNGTQQGVK